MKPAARRDWILEYIRKRTISTSYYVSVVDKDFVDGYAEATGAPCAVQFYGAAKCPQLGRDLSTMFQLGTLRRVCTGLGDMHSMGFPAWVWNYKV